MTIDEFFTEIADIEFVWEDDYSEDHVSVVRARNHLCPICALAAKLGHLITNNGQWGRAARYIGLSNDDAASIMAAADTEFIAGTIRDRLAALITTERAQK